MKRWISLFFALCLLVSLAGCRSRTTAVTPGAEDAAPATGAAQETPDDASRQEPDAGPEETLPPEDDPADPNAPTEEDPGSDRKEYDADSDAELSPGADSTLRIEGEGSGPVSEDGDSDFSSNVTNEDAENKVTETVPAEDAEHTGTAGEGELADTVLSYYQALLNERLGTLFECERLYVYWETTEDYTTVFRTSWEHRLILDAGAYDVSAKLLAENLVVDDGWVQRKNPGAIVKVVDAALLGSGVYGTGGAAAVSASLAARPGWSETAAVKNGNVILLSEELLGDQTMRTAAAVYLAKAMYPSLFADVDADEALRLLTAEAYGSEASGTYIFVE